LIWSMKIEVVAPEDFKFKQSSSFFLDSNIWMYLNFPEHTDVPQRVINRYSAFFKLLLTKQSLIQTNLIQMSELINLIINQEYIAWRKNNSAKTRKDFRIDPAFKKALSKAKTLTNAVLKCSTLRDGIFNSEQMKAMVDKCDKADFNDIYFADFCELTDVILVTHDYDFGALDKDVTIISANDKYLSS